MKKFFLIILILNLNSINFIQKSINFTKNNRKLISFPILSILIIYFIKKNFINKNLNIQKKEKLENTLLNYENFLSEDDYFDLINAKNSKYGISLIINGLEKDFSNTKMIESLNAINKNDELYSKLTPDKKTEEINENIKIQNIDFYKKKDNILINFIKNYAYLAYLSYLNIYSEDDFKVKNKIEELKKNKITELNEMINMFPDKSFLFFLKHAASLISKKIKCDDDYDKKKLMVITKNKNDIETKSIDNVPFYIFNNEKRDFEWLSDIHDCLPPLHKAFSSEKDDNVQVWLGDYIDKFKYINNDDDINSILTPGHLFSVTLIQLYLNKNFKLIRGNHESYLIMNTLYNTPLNTRLFINPIVDEYLAKIFPAAIIINNKIIGSHGYWCDNYEKNNKNNNIDGINLFNIIPNYITCDFYNNKKVATNPYKPNEKEDINCFKKNNIIASNLCDSSDLENNFIDPTRFLCNLNNHMDFHNKNNIKKCFHGHDQFIKKENNKDCFLDLNAYEQYKGPIYNINRLNDTENKRSLNLKYMCVHNKKIDTCEDCINKCIMLPLCSCDNMYEKKNNKKLYFTKIDKNNNITVVDILGQEVKFSKK